MADDPVGRSWTETMGNTIFFEGFDSVQYLNWLVDRNWQTPLVAPFLHEFTHRWCFASLLGNTLAFNELRIYAMSGRLPDFRSVSAQEFLAQQTVSNLLRPIAEGLALFAEYDLGPSQLEAGADRRHFGLKLGTPLTAANLCFARETSGPFSQFMLTDIRRSPEVIDRKASIYLLDFEVREGYLPGYLFVKWLYALMKLRVPSLSTEIFLAYVRCFFWEDPAAVKLLFHFHLPTTEYIRNLFSHFVSRIDQLRLAKDLAERVEEFWAAWSTKGIFRPGSGLFCDPAEYDEAVYYVSYTLEKSLELIAEAPKISDYVHSERVAWLCRTLPTFRRFTVVARCSVVVQYEEGRVAFILPTSDGTEERAYWPIAAPPPEGQHECFAVVSNFAEYLVIVLRQGKNIHFHNWIGPFDQMVHGQEVVQFATAIDEVASCVRELKKDFAERGLPTIGSDVLTKALDTSEKQAVNVYLNLIAGRRAADEETRQKEIGMLGEKGLSDIFGKRALGLRAFASLSLSLQHESAGHFFSVEEQAKLIRLFYLPEESVDDIRTAIKSTLTRDKNYLLNLRTEEQLHFII